MKIVPTSCEMIHLELNCENGKCGNIYRQDPPLDGFTMDDNSRHRTLHVC
jgi:hypothetical protein